MGAAAMRTMAAELDAAVPLASEGLEIARRIGTPLLIAMSLMALAGALVDRDPDRARTLLEESLELRSAVGFEGADPSTQAALIAAKTGDWLLTLQIAKRAIPYLRWGGERPWLSGILNVVARAIANTDAASAAVIQGAARRLVTTSLPTTRPAPTSDTAPPTAGTVPSGASFLTELRRETTGLIRDSLGETRLAEMRAEGEAMDEDHAVAFALEAIATALHKGASTPKLGT
jgi:hypothetical protein